MNCLCALIAALLLAFLPVTSLLAQTVAALPELQSAEGLGAELFQQSGETGMVLVVVRDGQVFFRGYGETAPNSHQVPTEESVVRLCSLTKIFTADVLAKLVADGTVRLDDPLQRFAPTGSVVPTRGRTITLGELAEHTSGLPRELSNGPVGTAHFTFPDFQTRWGWLPRQHLRSTPGSAALYSNLAFDFLGDALQSATHTAYPRLLAERTLDPLGMRDTTYFPTAEQCAHLLVGAHEEGPCTSTEQTDGSSGLYSTASDMTTWLKYLLGSGAQTQDTAAQAIYVAPSALVSQKGLDHAGEATGVGLGWIHILPVDSESHIVEKTGGGAGFTTYIAINHARRTAVFVAATEGSIYTHVNLFNAANKLLLAVAGLPPLPTPPVKIAPKGKVRARHVRRRS